MYIFLKKVINQALILYKKVYTDATETPYDRHKKGIKRFLRNNKEILKHNAILIINNSEAQLRVDNFSDKIVSIVVYYDYDDDEEDNEEFFIWRSYRNKDGKIENFMDLFKLKDLNSYIRNIFLEKVL